MIDTYAPGPPADLGISGLCMGCKAVAHRMHGKVSVLQCQRAVEHAGSTSKTGAWRLQEKMGIPIKVGMPIRAAFIFRPKKRREGPVEGLLIGLRDFAIEKVVSHVPPVFEARWTGKNTCPHCGCEKLRIKDSLYRVVTGLYRARTTPKTGQPDENQRR